MLLLKPSTSQKAILRRWMGAYRFVYNWTIDEKQKEYESTKTLSSYLQKRKEWTAKLRIEHPWTADKGLAAHTIYGAMMDADKDYKNMVRKRMRKENCALPRCRKKTQRSFFLLGNAVTNKGIYSRKIGLMRSSEQLPDKPKDCRIVHDLDGRWYLSVPYVVRCITTENQGVVALDPGVRTFITAVGSHGAAKIGSGSFGRIVRLAQHLDDLISRATNAPARKKRAMLQAAGRMRVRIRNLVDDMHYQSIGWLCRNYHTIIIPESNFNSACEKARRKLRRKSVRSLLTYAFARFRDRLVHKAQVSGNVVKIVCESYTSRTANWTGETVRNLGSRKTIASGGKTLDRDLNGALGVLLKSLLDQPRLDFKPCTCWQQANKKWL